MKQLFFLLLISCFVIKQNFIETMEHRTRVIEKIKETKSNSIKNEKPAYKNKELELEIKKKQLAIKNKQLAIKNKELEIRKKALAIKSKELNSIKNKQMEIRQKALAQKVAGLVYLIKNNKLAIKNKEQAQHVTLLVSQLVSYKNKELAQLGTQLAQLVTIKNKEQAMKIQEQEIRQKALTQRVALIDLIEYYLREAERVKPYFYMGGFFPLIYISEYTTRFAINFILRLERGAKNIAIYASRLGRGAKNIIQQIRENEDATTGN